MGPGGQGMLQAALSSPQVTRNSEKKNFSYSLFSVIHVHKLYVIPLVSVCNSPQSPLHHYLTYPPLLRRKFLVKEQFSEIHSFSFKPLTICTTPNTPKFRTAPFLLPRPEQHCSSYLSLTLHPSFPSCQISHNHVTFNLPLLFISIC